jgi:signal transduction histidine kinase
MATFVVIILLVGLVMGAYQSRLLNNYFRGIASNQLVQQARNMELLISRIAVAPPSDSAIVRNLVSVISSVTSSRVLVTDTRGIILVDSSDGQLAGQQVSPQYLRNALGQGQIETFDFPTAGTDAVGAAVPWRTGSYITGAMIFIKPLSTVARQSTLEAARFMVRAGVLATIVALILSYFLASNITDPLRRMAQVARSISKGDFRQRVDIESKDELGDLAQAMNSMSREISVLVDNLTEEKEKLKALAEERQNMMSDISHDLRTPITSIRGFVEALQDGVIKDPEEQRRTLSIIHDESERLSRLVEDLFYLARLEAGDIPVEMAPLDFADVVRSSMNTVRPQSLEKNIDLRLTADEAVQSGKAMVLGSADRLARAVLNLLDNAIKYSPEGGRVDVSLGVASSNPPGNDGWPAGGTHPSTPSATRASAPGAIYDCESTAAYGTPTGTHASAPGTTHASALAAAQYGTPTGSHEGGPTAMQSSAPAAAHISAPSAAHNSPQTARTNSPGRVTLSVSDQGPGIPEEALPHIFERFYRADKSRARIKSSAGLGLSIAKFIVDQHGGTLSVESELGKGTTMRMQLPLIAANEPQRP